MAAINLLTVYYILVDDCILLISFYIIICAILINKHESFTWFDNTYIYIFVIFRGIIWHLEYYECRNNYTALYMLYKHIIEYYTEKEREIQSL